jgi:putative thiamine transport system permease protein
LAQGAATVAIALPVAAGLLGTVLPSFGVATGSGQAGPTLHAWRELLAWPGLATSLLLTVRVGVGATALSLATALLLAVLARRAAVLRCLQALLPPLLATPHVALAVGLAFLAAPSGWLARLASPWLTGWEAPPDVPTIHDPAGLSLVVGLCLKETPYLLLAIFSALAQVPEGTQRSAAGLGYGPARVWLLVVLPAIWPQIRLPVLAVLAFSLSVVDVSLVLGPGNPPTLAVQVLRWFDSADIADWQVGSAGAVLLAALVGLALAAAVCAERVVRVVGLLLVRGGRRDGDGVWTDAAGRAAGLLLATLGGTSMLVLVLWAGAQTWRFPTALPAGWRADLVATRLSALGAPAWVTLALGLGTAALALVLAVAALAAGGGAGRLVFVPLLVPQAAFLWGQQLLLVRLRLDGGAFALVWAHLTFVLPYVLLSLSEPWRALDPRYARTAASLGAGPWRVLWRIRLPLLARPLLASLGVGFAVSVGLYLPTLFAGGGRVATLATTAVALASGPDRRTAAAAALAQAALPLAGFALAVLLPAWTARRGAG